MAKKKYKKTKEIPKIDMSVLEGLGAQINGITSNIEEQLKPLMELNNLESHIEKLKKTYAEANDAVKQTEDVDDAMVQDDDSDGEVCMHGNSWHSGCVECDDLMLIDNIFDVVDSTPNNMELGEKIRTMCSEFRKKSPHKTDLGGDKTAAETDDSIPFGDDMNYHIKDEENNNSSDDSATKDRKRWAG